MLLDLVKSACSEIGIPQPATVSSVSDETAQQLLALANREAREFSQLANPKGGWQRLHKSYTFGTVANQVAYALPLDFAYFIQRTFWSGSYRWELVGPISAQEKQVLTFGFTNTGPRQKYYVQNNMIYLNPAPTVDGSIIAFDYISNAFATNGGIAKSAFTSDSDVYLLDEDCFIMGLKWRYLRAKGMDYSQEKADYDQNCQQAMARDGGSPDLYIDGPRNTFRLIDYDNIPDGNWPS